MKIDLRNLKEINNRLVIRSEAEWIKVISKFQVYPSEQITAPVRRKIMIILLFCLFGVEQSSRKVILSSGFDMSIVSYVRVI